MRLADCRALFVMYLAFAPGVWAPASAADALSHADAPCRGLAPGPVRSVVRIIDGETLALDDGSEVRLIGALSPRALDVGAEPGYWPPETATRDELQALALGKSVELRFGGDRVDRYGRLLAQAILVDGDRRRWVQGHLLDRGLARAYAIAGNRACIVELLAAERGAREAHLGLWREAAYRVREAGRGLLSYRATFQVIDGRIARVAMVRGTIHVNFARNWWRAFSLSLSSAERSLLGGHAADPKSLEGRRVRVRGWIEERRGNPVIDLSRDGNIESLDADAASSRP